MTLEESVYFFENYKSNGDLFDVKNYLIALGNEDTLIIEEYKTKYGCIEEEYFVEWLEALLPYFKTNKSLESLKLSTQNELYLEQKSDINEGLSYLDKSKENWIGEPRILTAFQECLKQIQNFQIIQSHLHKVFPMICQVIDDFRADFKIKGVQLMTEFLRIVPTDLIIKFNLQSVVYESLKVNFSFESDDLVIKSIDLWIGLIGKVEEFPKKEFLKRSDELLLLICRDVVITSKLNRKIILLKSIGKVVDLMEYTSVRYLRKIVTTLCETVREDFTNDSVLSAGEESVIFVLKNCWFRVKENLELMEIIEQTFGGNEKIGNLLKKIKEI